MKKASTLLISAVLAFALTLGIAGCADPGAAADADRSASQTYTSGEESATGEASTTSPTAGGTSGDETTVTYRFPYTVIYDGEDLNDSWKSSAASFIMLADGSIRFDGAGATASDNTVTITAAGTYVVSGASTNGRIIVDLKEKGVVRLVLNEADITCPTGAPIYVKEATKTVITLANGTENYVTDGDSYLLENGETDEPDATIFSKDDLTINGTGSLTVTGNYNHGIAGKDDLKIVGGTITIDAVGDAIRGKDCIGVKDGAITAVAGGDGMQASNDVDVNRGYVDIQGGVIDITADSDGIQAESTLLVSGGHITLSIGGGSTNGGGANGAKGLKAAGAVFVTGGTLVVDSSDDSVHANDSIQIDGGRLTLASGDDGMHADGTIDINGGELTITRSYEGIEAGVVTIRSGIVRVTAGDDGINVAGGTEEPSVAGQRGQGPFTVNESNKLYIDGGYIVVDANGDGIDCNGRMFMTAGTLIINGPTSDGNGPLDFLGEFTISGGYVVAAGSSGMAQAPSQSSTMPSIMVGFESVQPAGALVHIADEDGNGILTFAPTKEYKSLLLCSADIQEGATYKVYVGGSSTGTATDGVYSGGSYTPGTEYATLTLSGIVTTYGSFGGMGRMMGDFAPGGPRDGWDDGTTPGGGAGSGGGTRPDRGTVPEGGAFPGGGTPPSGTGDTSTHTTIPGI